jgi:hypothetical protein
VVLRHIDVGSGDDLARLTRLDTVMNTVSDDPNRSASKPSLFCNVQVDASSALRHG